MNPRLFSTSLQVFSSGLKQSTLSAMPCGTDAASYQVLVCHSLTGVVGLVALEGISVPFSGTLITLEGSGMVM